jgi:hypothetical protein
VLVLWQFSWCQKIWGGGHSCEKVLKTDPNGNLQMWKTELKQTKLLMACMKFWGGGWNTLATPYLKMWGVNPRGVYAHICIMITCEVGLYIELLVLLLINSPCKCHIPSSKEKLANIGIILDKDKNIGPIMNQYMVNIGQILNQYWPILVQYCCYTRDTGA